MARKKNSPPKTHSVLNVDEKDSEKLLLQEEHSNDVQSANGSPEKSSKDITEADEARDKEQALDVQETLTDEEFEKELRKFIIPKLRSASYRWKYRSEAIKAARVARGLYRCAMCLREDIKNKEFAVDHVNPVVDLNGWDGNLDTYIRRMLVKTNGWQILCFECHAIKTQMEVQIRKIRREAKKAIDKSKK